MYQACASWRAELKKPLGCKAAAYCSKDCQVKDWKAGHRLACKRKRKTSKVNALCETCLDGKMHMVDKLLGEGVSTDEPNEGGWTPLMLASGVARGKGHGAVVEKLLENGASMAVQEKNGMATALILASQYRPAKGHGGVVKLLLGKGAKMDLQNEDGATALMLAK